MKLTTASLLSAAALLAPLGMRAQLAPYSREELNSLFNFVSASQLIPEGRLLRAAPLLVAVATEREEATLCDGAPRLDFTRLSFVEAANRVVPAMRESTVRAGKASDPKARRRCEWCRRELTRWRTCSWVAGVERRRGGAHRDFESSGFVHLNVNCRGLLVGGCARNGRNFMLLSKLFRVVWSGVRSLGFFSLLTAAGWAAAFTPGNLVVLRVGSGSGALVNTGSPAFLDEFSPAGVLVQSVALPTSASGANKPLILSGTATSEGLMTRSADGQYLLVPGYGATPPVAGLAGTSAATVPRVVARIAADGTVDTTTALSDFATGNNPRGATSSDGTTLWVTGGAGGVRAATLGGSTSVQLSTTVTNLRSVHIFGGQLLVSGSSGSVVRLGAVGTGLPTAAAQTIVNLPGFPTSGSPYAFFFADLSPGVAGVDTVYVADDSPGQIQKFSLVGGSWVASGTISATAVRGVTGTANAGNVVLYATGGSGSNGGTSLFTFTDTTGYNGSVSGTASVIASAAANTAFRGIAPAPVVAGAAFAPSIGTPPTPQSVTVGGTATFTAVASGQPAPGYVWRKGGVPLVNGGDVSGATSPTLTLANVALADNGTSYDVVVSNGIPPDATSPAVTLTVNAVANTPPSLVAAASTTARLSASPAGPASISGVLSDPTDPAKISGIDFTLADTETPATALSFTATSGNPTVVPNTGTALAVSGTGATRSLKISPAAVGYATITVTVTDGSGGSASYVINYAASAAGAQPATTRFFTGASDASTALALDASTMLVADDENQALRLYDRANSGLPIAAFDFTASLGLNDLNGSGQPREVDIEGSARVGNRVYFIGSESNNSDGPARPNRNRVFAADLAGSGAATTLSYVGRYDNLKGDFVAWDHNNAHGKGADYYGFTASSAAGVVSELADGGSYNIEALEFAPDNATAYVGFRSPIVPATARTKALIVPVTNFTQLVTGSALSATFGAPIEFDLGGRGIRELRKNSSNQYVIIAGPPDSATGVAPKDFRLYTWDGLAGSAPQLTTADLTALAAPGSFESIVEIPPTLTAASTLTLLLDNGDTVYYADGTIAKDLTTAAFKKFRSVEIALGAAAASAPSTVAWNFTAGAAPSSGLPGDVSEGVFTAGNNNGAPPLVSSTSASSGYAGATGGNNVGAAARIGALSQSGPTPSAYFEFTLLPSAGKQLTATALKFGSRSTGTGPQAFSVFTSVDGFTTPVATGALANNSTWALQTPSFTSVTGLTGTAVTFRIFGYNGIGSPAAGTANWRLDDVALTISTAVGAPITPVVASTAPAAGATNILPNAPLTVTFNQPVTVSGTWFTLSGATSGLHTATVTGGPTSYTLTPDVAFTGGEAVTLTVLASQVIDQATGTLHPAGNFTASFTTLSAVPIAIHTVQGSGLTSPYATQTVTIEGVVVASFQGAGKIGGYYLEAPTAAHDADSATSEGIYVFDNANSVTVGDFVTITGTVTEFGAAPNSETEISPVLAFSKTSTGNPLPASVTVSLPFPSSGFAERYEGMLVTFPGTLTVTDNFDYGHFGELILSNGRLQTPTNIVAPGAPAQALAAANLLNQVIVDDGVSTTYPDPTPFLTSADPTTATRRAGSTTTGLTGILDNKFGAYVIEPTVAPVFVDANPRTSPPNPGGSFHVAIGNVLNFFNGNGAGAGFPTSRGADTFAEYQRQRAKILAGILSVSPDIMGLTEVENDGFGAASAIQDLVNGLNAGAPAGITYAFVNPGLAAIGTDQITCGFIYKTNTVALVGTAAVNLDAVFNRPPIAQTFRQISTGEKLTITINHFKSKGSPPSSGPDTDQGDGQSAWNVTRVAQAQALTAWLATNPTGDADPDVLIIGDLNSYAKEDPITAIKNAGFINLTETFEGAGGYSYAFNAEFGHLDHALGSASLAAQTTGAESWHVNADEPVYYDYNVENKTAAQQAINVGTAFRYSDHDPVVIGLNLAPPGPPTQSYAAWAAANSLAGANASFTADVEADGIVNLLEYFLGLNPTVSNPTGLPTGGVEGADFVFRFNRAKTVTGATFRVLTSVDLITWTPVSPAPAVESSATDFDTYVAKIPLGSARLFARLEVTSGGTSVATVPVGWLNFVIAAGTPAAPVTTVFGVPLDDPAPPAAGIRAGRVDAFTGNTLSNFSGGWATNLAAPAAPWGVRLTSGASAGKVLDITANTATTLTVSGADLTTLGVVAGTDTFELVPMDTLLSLFGTTTLLGGTSAGAADNVQVRSGASWLAYYFDTNLGIWRRTIGPATNAGNTRIRPETGVQILRRGPVKTLGSTGRVPITAFRPAISNAATTVIHSGFPTDTTLGALALQTLLPGWRSALTAANADSVFLFQAGAWVGYFHNGAGWQAVSDGALSDAVPIPVGALLTIQRPGATPGVTELVRLPPYTL